MRAGVERARSRGFAVVVWVGGRVEGETRRRGPLLKLGALELNSETAAAQDSGVGSRDTYPADALPATCRPTR